MTKEELLKTYFGYDSFREGQKLLIDSILEGKDTLGIMPTGAGKSICYQIPALMLKGVALVVSPLISLMKDQVAGLNQAGIHAAFLNSSLTYGQYQKALYLARAGRYSIVYVAPERLLTGEFLDFARNTEISMVAVDEAHCVSQWGQDFRPGYLKIAEFVKSLPKRPRICAFTATATREVREDIIDILTLQSPTVLTTGFDRENLYFAVETPKNKYEAAKRYVQKHRKESGIIYCLTRKTVEEVTEKLIRDGFSATRYHAGLSDSERRKNQEDFIYDQCPIMVATNAFGMGIDKSNVRYVLHYNMPKNMESYYQEAGRAGRDGEKAECVLFYGGQDVVTNQRFLERNQNPELDEATRAMVKERDRERLRKMTYYCFTRECLREYMLRYFGEYGDNYCGNCSNCLESFETADVTEIALAMLQCVQESRQRYGINVIIDTLHGARTAKLCQYRMDENPCYGSLEKIPSYRIRQVLNHLLTEGYLTLSDDEYFIVRFTKKSGEILKEGKRIQMKLAKEERRETAEKEKSGKKKTLGIVLEGKDEGLFEALRKRRMEIAREEKVPPYLVFSDKSLVHMCIRKPRDKEEMMEISGVGAYKYEKYGEKFLEILRACCADKK